MPRIKLVRRSGEVEEINADRDLTLMEAIRDSGCDELLALCGGVCSCATCHVHISPDFLEALPAITEDEDGLLEGSRFRNRSSRLSCQVRITEEFDGLTVAIAPED